MADGTTDKDSALNTCRNDDDDDDCPPPIPPRPSFTFAARRDVLLSQPADCSAVPTRMHADDISEVMSTGLKTDTMSEVMSTELKTDTTSEVMSTGLKTDTMSEVMSTGLKTDTMSEVMSTGLKTDTTSEVMSTGLKTDTMSEVMSTGLKTEAEVESGERHPVPPPRYKSKKSTNGELESVDRGEALLSPAVNDDVFLTCDTDAVLADETTVYQHLTTEHQSNGVLAAPSSELQSQSTSEKQMPSSASCSSDVKGLCDAAASVETPGTCCSGDVGGEGSEAVCNEWSVDSVGIGRHEPASSTHHESNPAPSRAPLVSFSEFEDFGLDPDLFRPDCLDSDVPFSEKTAKFTRPASPLYETLLDEDDIGE